MLPNPARGTNTLPLFSSVAVWEDSAVDRLPVADHSPAAADIHSQHKEECSKTVIPVPGSYISQEERSLKLPSLPPVTKTLPLASNVAVCPYRTNERLPVAAHVPAPRQTRELQTKNEPYPWQGHRAHMIHKRPQSFSHQPPAPCRWSTASLCEKNEPMTCCLWLSTFL